MSLIAKSLSILLKVLSSSKLALAIVVLLILFSVAGTTIPQKDRVNSEDIAQWQTDNPATTAIAKPIGLFSVFTSWPFMITLFALAVNTLTCTILSFKKDGGFACFKGPKKLEKYGFYLLHLSILVLLAGGFAGTAMKLTGYIALTEGQTFVEDHNNYMRLAEGPLRRESHKGFALKLDRIETKYEQGFYQTDLTAHLDVLEKGEKVLGGTVKVNYPFNYRSLAFTYQDIGFSPRIEIKGKNTGRVQFYSFVMLKTFGTPQGKLYRDYLPIAFLKDRTIVTVYPSYKMVDGEPVKTSEEPDKPLIRIEVENDAREVVSKLHVPLGQSTTVGEHIIKFTDLRRWVAFEVVEDPGYLTVCIALWLGLAALVLRYIPDLRKWFGPETKRD